MSPPSAPPFPQRSTRIAEGLWHRPRSNRRLLRAGVTLPSKAASGLTLGERSRNRESELLLSRGLKLLLSCPYLQILGLRIVESLCVRRSHRQADRRRRGMF